MANKSVLELAIETGKWDSGLKKAQQALDRFVSAGGGLNSALEKDNEKIRQFVQMMGKMESTANTAKGQMNDYKRTLESLTFQYNTLTDAQKKVVGGDFLKSIDSIKEKFQQAKDQVADFNKSIGDIKEPKIEGWRFHQRHRQYARSLWRQHDDKGCWCFDWFGGKGYRCSQPECTNGFCG